MSKITRSKIVNPAKLSVLAGALLLLPAVASAYNYAPSNAPRHTSGGTHYYSDTSSYYGRGYSSCCRSRGTVVYDDYGAHYYGSRYYSSCGCYRGYYIGYRHDGYGSDLYDYSAQVYDDRTHLDRRTPYEYRWPRRND